MTSAVKAGRTGCDGQAGPLTAIESLPGTGGDLWPAHGDPGRTVEALNRYDFAEFFHDSGKHPRLRLLRAVHSPAPGYARARLRGLALARNATPSRVLPPIRAFTVGPGIPPGQPARHQAWRGSRTVTAGSEFHRPRSTLSLR
jgi:hypothetical protein